MTESAAAEPNTNNYIVYGRPWCGYCSAAVSLLKRAGLDFEYIDIREQGISKADLADKLGRPVFTVPQIVQGDRYIGGYTDLVPYLRSL